VTSLSTVFPILTIPFLLARFDAKIFLIKKFHPDDCKYSFSVPKGERFRLTMTDRHDYIGTGAPPSLPSALLRLLIDILLQPFALAHSILQMDREFDGSHSKLYYSRLRSFAETKNGSGYHVWDITMTKYEKYFFVRKSPSSLAVFLSHSSPGWWNLQSLLIRNGNTIL
jgi:hypothetical protein